MTVTYAGIGSRETPEEICTRMTSLARLLMPLARLRTGGANGADNAFLAGVDRDHVELYLPWKGFNGHKYGFLPSQAAFDLAAKYHPRWGSLTRGARCLMARNMHQALGPLLNDPVRCVVCWTSDGKASGGTGQVLRWAEEQKVRVFNLHNSSIKDEDILKCVSGS